MVLMVYVPVTDLLAHKPAEAFGWICYYTVASGPHASSNVAIVVFTMNPAVPMRLVAFVLALVRPWLSALAETLERLALWLGASIRMGERKRWKNKIGHWPLFDE